MNLVSVYNNYKKQEPSMWDFLKSTSINTVELPAFAHDDDRGRIHFSRMVIPIRIELTLTFYYNEIVRSGIKKLDEDFIFKNRRKPIKVINPKVISIETSLGYNEDQDITVKIIAKEITCNLEDKKWIV